jgi:hypothetical protein
MSKLNQRIKNVCDSVGEYFGRMDAGEGVFARNLVTATIQELYKFEYPSTRWANGELIDWQTGIDAGAKEFGYLQAGSVGGGEPGASGIVADNATDIPEVDVNGDYHLGRVHTVACSFSYSYQDLESARLQGLFDMAQLKAQSAKEKHDRDLNALMAFGSAPHGLEGITNATGITVLPATTGNWATATALQINTDFSTAFDLIVAQSGGVEEPTHAVLSPGIFSRLKGLQNSGASDVSVMSYIEDSYGIKFEKENTMATADASGGNAMLLYRKDRSRVAAVMPRYLTPVPVQFHGLSMKVVMWSRFAGIMVPRPLSILRLDGI